MLVAMNLGKWVAILGNALLLTGCGDDTQTGGGGGAGASATGGAATGGESSAGAPAGGADVGGAATGGAGGQAAGGAPPANSGDCDTAADCPPDTECMEVAAGGYRVCTDVVVEAVACGSKLDECCNTARCAEGLCLSTPLTPFCGGVQQVEYNVCAVDQCDNQGDCNGQDSVCLSAPMLGYKVRACYYTQCRHDTDCEAEVGGICAPVQEPCCGGSAGLYCVYPSDGCRTNADCVDGYCQPGVDRATCETGGPICPA